MAEIVGNEKVTEGRKEKPANQCQSCHQIFSFGSALWKHLRTVDCSAGIHKCDKCPKVFYKIEKLQSHRELQHEDKFLTHGCNICNKLFCSKGDRNRHTRSVHLKEKDFSCLFCEMTFTARGTLNEHIRKHTGESYHLTKFPCGYCDVISNGKTERRIHLATFHKKYKCQLCGIMVSTAQSLENHMSTHTGEKAHACPACPKKFNSAHKLKLHFRVHTGEKPIKCNQCTKSFTRSESLRIHREMFHVENARILKCVFCNKEENHVNKSKFDEHLRGHTGEKPYNCQQCKKSYQGYQGLRYHMRAVHSTAKPFACDVCQMRFANRTNLNLHKQCHVKIGTHKCSHCSKVFVRKGGLRRHLTIHETDINFRLPFECIFCKKRYSSNPALVFHLLSHIGEKPMQCDLCEKAFATMIQLRVHMTSHTREKYFKCRICSTRYPYSTSLQRHMISAHNTKR